PRPARGRLAGDARRAPRGRLAQLLALPLRLGRLDRLSRMRRLRRRAARDGAGRREHTLASRDGGVLPESRGAPPGRGPVPARRDLPSRLTVAAATEPLLRLEHAAKSFGAVRALEDVHIELYAG